MLGVFTNNEIKKIPLKRKDRSKPKPSNKKKSISYLPIIINQEEKEKYNVYFVPFSSSKREESILKQFLQILEEYELSDLVKIEEIHSRTTTFKDYELIAIKRFVDLCDQMFHEFKIKKKPISGKFNIKIKDEEKTIKDEEETIEEKIQELINNGKIINML